MQIGQLGNISFTGFAHVKGSEEDAVAIKRLANADIQGFGPYPVKNWVLATGDDIDKMVQLRNDVDRFSGTTLRSGFRNFRELGERRTMQERIFGSFASKLPTFDAKEALKAIQKRAFNLDELTFIRK